MRRRDMTAAAKFVASCARCGVKQKQPTTAFTAEQWMTRHEQSHRDADNEQLRNALNRATSA